MKNYKKAIKNYNECYEINDNLNNINLLIGRCYLELNENKIAENLYVISYTFSIIFLTIIMAHLSYKYYESYFLKFKKPTTHE
jgi:tetratricopeptide (TPR) repeat protein